jgi:hypothetical protein
VYLIKVEYFEVGKTRKVAVANLKYSSSTEETRSPLRYRRTLGHETG